MTMQLLEQYILDAERAFEQQLYMEGKNYLEDALAVEPTYGKAHNHMGWLYLFPLSDPEQAEMHLKLAIRYAPGYKAAYLHMIHLLFESGRLEELAELLEKAAKVQGITKTYLFNEYGRMYEVQGLYRNAIRQYKMAIRWSTDRFEIQTIEENIKRCRSKQWLLFK